VRVRGRGGGCVRGGRARGPRARAAGGPVRGAGGDHGRSQSEFYSRRTDAWTYQQGVRLIFSRPGTPMDNPFIERCNGRLRDEHLNIELFFSIVDAQQKILEWQRDDNEDRPHSSLGDIPPREFAAQWQLNQAAGGDILNLETV
jgi:transposase InsO family protein